MPAPLRKITKALVDALATDELAWDTEVKGFGVRCQRRDRVYVLKYRISGRQPRRLRTVVLVAAHGRVQAGDLSEILGGGVVILKRDIGVARRL